MPATLVSDRDYIAQTGDIPEGKQLLRDSIPLTIVDKKKIMTESASGQKMPAMKLTGIFQRADHKNANGRVYPVPVLKEAVEALKEPIKCRRVMGEFDHPADAKIHMDRVSHIMTKLWMEGKIVYGEIEVINDPRSQFGSLLSCYVDRGIQVSVSSRGVGDMEMDLFEGEDAYIVQPGYNLITFDAVAEPSVTDAQLRRLNESLQKRAKNPKMLREMREKLLLKELGNILF